MAQKVFVTGDSMAVFECPECKKSKAVDVSRYKGIKQVIRIKVKCPCGYSFSVVLERRKSYRKKVNFPGSYTYFLSDNKRERGMMTVKDLSLSGIKIKLNVKKDFKIGNNLSVEFRLDDQNRSFVKKDAVIRTIYDQNLGVEFTSIDSSNPSDAAIGFYMFD